MIKSVSELCIAAQPHPTMKDTTNDLPPKLQTFASLLDAQPPEVQEAFQFLLTTAKTTATPA